MCLNEIKGVTRGGAAFYDGVHSYTKCFSNLGFENKPVLFYFFYEKLKYYVQCSINIFLITAEKLNITHYGTKSYLNFWGMHDVFSKVWVLR